MWILILALLSSAETVNSNAKTDRLPAFKASPARALKELTCLQKNDPNKEMGSTFQSCMATKMIEHLAKPLDRIFAEHQMDAKHRALFYSQVLEESASLTHMTEAKDLSSGCSGGSTGLDMLVQNALSDNPNKSTFQGRGPLQLTGCANYLSAIHYMNLKLSGQTPKWQPYWYTDLGSSIKKDESTKKPLNSQIDNSQTCNPSQIKKLSKKYEETYGMALDPYGILKEPLRLAMIDGVLEKEATITNLASDIPQTYSGTQYMLEITMGYWLNRCGDVTDKLLNPETRKTFEDCLPRKDKRETANEHISRCATMCVKSNDLPYKGNDRDPTLDKRQMWFELAQKCIQ